MMLVRALEARKKAEVSGVSNIILSVNVLKLLDIITDEATYKQAFRFSTHCQPTSVG